MIRRVLPAAACLLAVAGCSSSSDQVASSSASSAAPSVSVPADATTLQQLGLRNGPVDLQLPSTVLLESAIDQPNVVTLTMPTSQGAPVSSWLTRRLAPGWVVQAHRGTSVVFHTAPGRAQPWEGGFTCSAQTCALTLRQQ